MGGWLGGCDGWVCGWMVRCVCVCGWMIGFVGMWVDSCLDM